MLASTLVDDRVLIDVRANNLAFHIGQWVEETLLDRSLEIVRRSGASVVTTEHVESCLNHALFDELLKWMKEGKSDRPQDAGRFDDEQSRKAA
jgi:hypothetical protein